MAATRYSALSIHTIERIFETSPVPTVRALEIPGHDRDALAGLDTFADNDVMDVEHPMHSQAAVDALDTIGLDDARIILDELSYNEWASSQDELDPSREDVAAARIASLG